MRSKAESRKWKGATRRDLRGARSVPIPLSPFPIGVTLIELLITVTIIAILSAVFLGASRSAMEAARAARTKTTIAKIHGLVMERWNLYATRRFDVSPVNVLQPIEQQFRLDNVSPRQRGEMLADARLFALRELMKLEMPDRWSDVLNLASSNDWHSDPRLTHHFGARMLSAPPALSRVYQRRLRSLKTDDLAVIQDNEGAECLYMIVMHATGDGEARTLFNQRDIGDTDGDGAPEFLDGWGQPIKFVRWPAGFVQLSSLMVGDGDKDHDPFDPFQRDTIAAMARRRNILSYYPASMQFLLGLSKDRHQRAATPTEANPPYLTTFRLVPLVFSSGPDQDSDVNVSVGATTAADPYIDRYGTDGLSQLGLPFDVDGNGNGWNDNIHNHLQDSR